MLVKALVVSVLTLASGQLLAAQCTADVESTDQMTFGDTKAIAISKTCKTFTVNLTHSGSLPKNIMGHNWVLSTASDAPGIASDGMTAGLDKDYLKPADPRVIAHTTMIGAGQQASVTFNVSKLSVGEQYEFFCTFPGHISMMKGALTLVE